MTRSSITFFLLLLLCFQATAQAPYTNYIVTDRFIVTTGDGGHLNLFDRADGVKRDSSIACLAGIRLLAKDRQSNPVIVDSTGAIRKYTPVSRSWHLLSKHQGPVWGILWNSRNVCYLITEKGIECPATGKRYYSGRSLNDQIRYHGRWSRPYCCFMDRHDRIWLGFGYGEWGGNIFVFETGTNKFVTPELNGFPIDLNPIKSFFEDDSCVYLTYGLQHMLTSGGIVRFNGLRAMALLKSDSHWSESSGADGRKRMVDGAYLGPGAYSSWDSCLYFYSQNGIHRALKSRDLSDIGNWEVVFRPEFHWTEGQPDAVGSPMNVLKMDIIGKDRILLLSQNDGIGLYNGRELILLE